ncbi:hypothetical protein BDR07DRAFT_1405540 [Suillus spraguei]|nr:hypothetical protein BDR07DRAFT_1405540 [Suillus spraguei]
MEANNDYDFSLSMASLLRVGTSQAHEAAEHSQGGVRLVKGELDKEEYVYFLMMMWHVYTELERGLEKHASYPTLQPTYNPALLSRTPSLSQDISYLLGVPEAAWQTHPSHSSLMTSPPKCFTEYTTRLRELSESADPTCLLAHAYVRYLGDMSGGQFIGRRIAKAYDLDMDQGDGEWYRDGMNAGIGDDTTLKAAVLEEANMAFKMNASIFDLLSGDRQVQEPQQPAVPAKQAKGLYDPILGGLLPVALTVGLALVVYIGTGGASGGRIFRGAESWLRN